MEGPEGNRLTGWTRGVIRTFILFFAAAASAASAQSVPAADHHDTVIWISMDGMRADYLDRAPLPFFRRMMSEGVSTRRLRPTFPSVTFPSHCSQATGVGVDEHGVSGNGFYDSATHRKYNYPADASLLGAEPIWLTASRQGVRTAVFDWPLSQKETGPVRGAYFNQEFVQQTTDEERLAHLLTVWKEDTATNAVSEPLRLLMAYVEGTDPVGHRFGPDAPEITAEMVRLDGEMNRFQEAALAQWKNLGSRGHIYFLFTTDHGMSKVEKVVDMDKLLGLTRGQQEVNVAFTGNTGSVFFDGITDAGTRRARLETAFGTLKALPFAQTFRREDLPVEWHFAHPTRVGDLVVVLAKGYTFGKFQAEAVMDIAQVGSPKGMHGYPIGDDPEMYGPMILWRFPDPFGGWDLGEVNWGQLHPTVAKLLGIRPAATAKGKPIDLR